MLTAAWLAGPVLAWAVSGGRRRGAVAAIVLGGADLATRDRISPSALTGAIPHALAGVVVGHVARLAVQAEERCSGRWNWRRPPASGNGWPATSTTRCSRCSRWSGGAARTWTARRPSWPGWPASRRRAAGADRPGGRAAGPGRGRAGPARPDRQVRLGHGGGVRARHTGAVARATAGELGAAVGAALDNVARHAGGRAWVLIEDEETETVLGTRRGAGIPDGRLAEAAAQGRLGVAQSIRGRVADLGGEVRIASAPGAGTEIELVVPRSRG
ncbi:DUF5931 domain-containing protein [Micromonospora sp. BRA006-A]|nr:DUF5931 domain-containing protein [Micromonospora sp. BRA006-A]